LAGAVNGMILPVALAVVLIAARIPTLVNGYRHPVWMQACGWAVVGLMGWMGALALIDWMAG